jgi:hypothetical protein
VLLILWSLNLTDLKLTLPTKTLVPLSLSGDGTRLAVASPGAYIGAHDVGQVQIYEIGAGQVGARDRWSRRNDFSDRPSPFPVERLLLLEH